MNWGVSGSDGGTSLNDVQDTIKKKLSPLADSFLNTSQLNQSIPSLDEGQQLLREKCLKNSQLNNSYELTMVILCFLSAYE